MKKQKRLVTTRSVSFPPSMAEALEEYAQHNDFESLSSVIRRACSEFLRKQSASINEEAKA